MSDWHIYKKKADEPHDDIVKEGRLPKPPSWRDFANRKSWEMRGRSYQPDVHEVEMVNTALYLRRPLLITGNPGSGKSSLAHAVAWQLNLGPVLWWPINSRSTLQESLYNYDALGRLRDLNIENLESKSQNGNKSTEPTPAERLGRYIRLGPLGTALYGGGRPRVLLIDEIDKSDIDLPNDLLHVLEEGSFDIPELQRLTPDDLNEQAESAGQEEESAIKVDVYPHGKNKRSELVQITDGHVQCDHFPLIILTSNGERELPAAFRRRCLSLDIEDPKGDRLRDIVAAHFEESIPAGEADDTERAGHLPSDVTELIEQFAQRRDGERALLATDQLLNAVYLITSNQEYSNGERERILHTVLRELGRK